MGIDSSIYQMSGRGVKSVNEYNAEAQQAQQNKLALMAGMQTNELNKLKMDEYQRGVQQSNALRGILSGEYKDPTERQNAMIKGGFLKEATDYGKNIADVSKTESEVKAKQIEVAQKRLDLAGSAFGFVRQNPTPENAIAAIDYLVSNGIYSPEQGNEYKAKVTANPGNVAQMADLAFRGALAAKEQLTKQQSVNLGGTQENQSIDPVSGKVSVLSSAPITQSADSKASVGATYARLAEDRRHNQASESNQSLTLQQGRVPAGYRALPDGSLTFIKGGPADPETARRAAPTEFQGKSATFGTRAEEADKIINDVTGKYSPAALGTKQALGKTWVVGGALEAGANSMLSDNTQKAEQAQRNFVNAVLRQESGAAIAESEFANAQKQYFPQPGDSKTVIDQKAANRKMAIQGLKNNAGKAYTPFSDPNDIHSAADAILKGN